MSGRLEGLGSANFPVGMFSEAEYQSSRMQFEPGDFLVIYTDGVSEATIPAMNYSKKRGCADSWKISRRERQAMGDAIREGMRVFTEGAAQSDDITILVIQYKGNAA